MNKHYLDQQVVFAKEEGNRAWARLTDEHGIAKGTIPPAKVFNLFADHCESDTVFFLQTPKCNNLKAIEAFLRAGKHMPKDVKADNRRKADKLYDELLKEG